MSLLPAHPTAPLASRTDGKGLAAPLAFERCSTVAISPPDRTRASRLERPTLQNELREQRSEAFRRGACHAALRDQSGHESRRRYVEGKVDRTRPRWCDLDPCQFSISGAPGHFDDLLAIALLDRDPATALRAPVDCRRRQRDIERDVVVARGERLVVGSDLVADVAVGRGAVRA